MAALDSPQRLNATGAYVRSIKAYAAVDASAEAESSSLNGHGIFAVIVFATVMFIVIQPVRVPIPLAISIWVGGKWQRLTGQRVCNLKGDGSSLPSNLSASSVIESDQSPVAQPFPQRKYLVLNNVSAPVAGILVLLATKTIGGEIIKLGIVGSKGVEPYDALLLFLGLAYIAISLDTTGLLRFLAFHVAIRGGSSGPRLFYFLYAFFFLLGLLVGNDAVVLSGTSFLAHFTRIAGLARPDAWIWAQFAAANIASATLVSSNLTNVVIANGFGLKFTIFSAFMALPTVASGLGAVLAIRLVFINRRAEATCKPRWLARVVRKISRSSNKVAASEVDSRQMAGVVTLAEASAGPSELTRRGSIAPSVASGTKAIAAAEALGEEHDEDKDANASSSNSPQRALSQQVVFIPPFLVAPDVQPRAVLIDPFGAIFGSVVMAITLVVLIATSVVGGVKVYQVAVPAAFVCLLKDLWKDLSDSQRHRLQKGKESDREAKSRAQGNANVVVELGELSNKSGMNAKDIAVSKTLDGIDNARPGPSTSSIDPLFGVLSIPGKIASVIPTVSHVATRLPLPLVPFAFGMFILDESLAHVGFIHIMACWMGKACASGGEIGSAFFIGFLCVFLCCFGGTNIGASILLVRSIQDAGFQSTLPLAQRDSITQIALYSLALGSNVGALGGIFAASLAGLLWRGCLRHGGITVQPGQFFVWSLLTMPLSLSAGLVVVWAQVKSGKWPM